MTLPCREACISGGEPLAGSAGQPFAFAAISWPKPRWHRDKAARSAGLPPELSALEARTGSAGRKLALRVFQRAPGTPTDRVELVWHRAPNDGFQVADLAPGDLAATIERALAGTRPPDALPLAPWIFVCTDGRHDPCCAAAGHALFDALRGEAQRRHSPIAIAESSHLGGHRFSANCLSLPGGEAYGRVDPADAPDLLDAVSRGTVLSHRYRGRQGLPPLEQATEAFLYAELPELTGIEFEDVAATASPEDAEVADVLAHVTDRAGNREVRVHCERRTFLGPTSCGPAVEPTEQQRWLAVSFC